MPPAISKPALERLVQLARLLEQMEKNAAKAGGEVKNPVSSADLQRLTGWTRDTIRRDISLLGADCACPGGYDAQALKTAIRAKLRLESAVKKCCLVGLGKLGSALVSYEGFAGSVFEICAGFDTSVNRTETLRAPFPLYTTARMAEVIRAAGIELALLAVPAAAAQSAAEKLVHCGIRGIVNFTPAVLSLPAEIIVENVSVLDALQKIAVKSALELI